MSLSSSNLIILNNERALSTVVAKAFLLALMLMLGVLAPFTFIAQLTGMSFNLYSIIGSLLIFVSAAYAVKIFIDDYRTVQAHDVKILILLLCLGLLGLMLALLTNKPNLDDFMYVPNAVYFLQNPEKPMDFLVHFFYINPTQPFALSYNQGVSMPYEYSQAIIAKFAKVNFLDIYYILMPAVMGFMLPFANYFLVGKFTKNTTLALTGTSIIIILLLTLESHTSFGYFSLPRIFQGKALALSIGVPIFVAFSLIYFTQKSIENWTALFVTVTALIGMSSSAAILFPILAVALLISVWAIEWNNLKTKMPSFFIDGALYLTTCSLAIIYLLFLFMKIKVNGANADPFSLEISGGTNFLDNLKVWINPTLPLAPIFMALMLLLVIFAVKGWQRRFILAWTSTMFCLFLNPFSAKFLIGTLIPSAMYMRLMYLLPFPISAAVCVSSVIGKSEPKRNPIVFLSVLGLLSISTFGYLSNFSQKNQLDFATYKLPLNDIKDAQAIIAAAPSGVMLAPDNLYGIIPILSSSSPQIRSNNGVRGFWIDYREEVMRENASKFAGGDPLYERNFIYVIKEGFVEVVVCKASIFHSPVGARVATILRMNGFVHKKVVNNYLVFWKEKSK